MGQEGGPDPPPHSGKITYTITSDQACRLLMLEMRWKAPNRAVNLSQVAAQGDAALQVFLLRCLRGENARSGLPKTSLASIDAVASEILTRPLEHIDCDTHQRTPRNTTIKLLDVLV